MTHQCADRCDPTDRRQRAREALNALLARYRGSGHTPGERELIDGLFVNDGEAAGLLTGIIELSVSFRADRTPTIRALSEVLPRRPLDSALARVGLEWGMDMLCRVTACGSESYAAPLFRELYELVYFLEAAEPLPTFRFGIATEFGDAPPILKLYFDLYATRAEQRQHTLARVAELLGETSCLDTWQRAWPGIDFNISRVIGVDFGAGNVVRTKFYWGARQLTWDGIVVAARQICGERQVETLHCLAREITAVPTTLPSVQVSMCDTDGVHSLKLDVCVARLFDNDGQAYEAIERFRGPAVEREGAAPFDIVSDGLDPHQTRCVHQYLGLELSPDRSPRVTIYYRPIGFETAHLNPALRPRLCT